MIVVADASPLNYLIQIDCQSLLPRLYDHVLIPAAVIAELQDPNTPSNVQLWLSDLPDWVEVGRIAAVADPALNTLGPGEREAIQLAQEQHAHLLLIDERRGRAEAVRRGLATTGTLGVLLAGAERGFVDAISAYNRLMHETNFRATPALQRNFLQQIRSSER
jgi:predicted nucleic acid-binding protein